METQLINEDEYRGCKILFFKQWNSHDFDGVSYFYEITDRQGESRTDQTDEYPLGSLDCANRNAILSIDWELDKQWSISCLATYRNKHEHFPLTFHGEQDGAIEVGLKELSKRYPNWKHSVKVCESG
jgi:hypothetical protein